MTVMRAAKGLEIADRLSDAREQLAVAKAALIGVDDEEAAAIDTPETYTAWRAKRDSAEAEIERQTKLVGALELETEEACRAAAETNFRRRHAEKLKSNPELAQRIR